MKKTGFSSWPSPARVFAIDLRTLAFFRIALAIVLLGDLTSRAVNLKAFYSDQGVLPRSAQIEIYSNLPWLLSLHLMSGLVAVQVVLFIVAFLSALSLLLGYRTRFVTFLSWLLLVSLHNRNPMVLQGGDVLLRMLLFWGWFLPLGAVASLDRHIYRKASSQDDSGSSPQTFPSVLSVASAAVILQVCFVYWFSVALKSDISWHSEGSALYYALSIDQMVKTPGKWLLAAPKLLHLLTFATLALEWWGPFIALLPFWRLRVIVVLFFLGFHIALGTCLTLGIFSPVAMVAWILFIPAEAWDRLEPRWARSRLAAKSESSRAALAGLRDRFLALLGAPDLTKIGVGRKQNAWFPQLVAGAFLIYIFLWNCRTVNFDSVSRYFPVKVNWVGELTRTDQQWGMFAPYPLKDDGWFIVPARMANGKVVDLLSGGRPVTWKKPLLISATYPDSLWQKYLMNIWQISNAAHRSYYAAYLTREWNQNHNQNQQIKSLQIVYMREDTLPKGTAPVYKVVLWQQKS